MEIGSYSGAPYINRAVQGVDDSAQRIASGSRINSAADDAAGLSISNRMNSAVKGFDQSIRNANDGISMLQTTGATLSGVTEGVQRLRELALQASNGILNDSDRSAINKEAQQLISEIGNSVNNASFNNQPLLTKDSETALQVGAGEDDQVSIENRNFAAVLEDSGFNSLDFSSAEGAANALGVLDQVQGEADQLNADIGASINRLDSTVNNLTDASINTQASMSRIKDADMAKEISDMANEQTKRDVSIAMQTLANQQKGNVLKLLEG